MPPPPPPAPVAADRHRPSAPGLLSPLAHPPSSLPSPGLRSSVSAPLSIPRRLPVGDPAMVSRVTSRGERLAAALRRGFVSARALQLRAGPPALSELVGPMAPERYLALPRRSIVAARAMVAVALAKGDRDVARLETFRRSGSLRSDSGRAMIDDQEDSTPREWFDEVAAALLGNPLGDAVTEAVETMKVLKIGSNKCHATLRRAQMPAEAFRLDATGGINYTEATAPARELDPEESAVAAPLSKVEAVDVDALPPADPLPAAPPQDMLFPELDVEDKPPLPEVEIDEPLLEADAPNPNEAMEIDTGEKDPLKALEPKTQPVVDVDDVVNAVPLKLETEEGAAVMSQKLRSGTKTSSEKPEDASADHSDVVPEGACTVVGKKGTHFSLWLVEREEEKFDIDFHIEDATAAKPSGDPDRKQTAMEVVEVDDVPTVDLRSDGDDGDVGYKVRRDGPVGMLEEMLHDLSNKDPSPKRPSGRPAPPGTEIVCIDGDDEGERDNQRAPPLSKRPRKRKVASFVRSGRKKKMEERKARMVTAVVQTLQEDPEATRKRVDRTAGSVANGHRPAQARKDDKEKRHSRRSKKSVSLVEMSDEGEPSVSKQVDEDFDIINEEDDAVEVPPATRAPSAKAAAPAKAAVPATAATPVSPPAPRSNPVPRTTRSTHQNQNRVSTTRSKKATQERTDVENDGIALEKPRKPSLQESQSIWEREIARVAKAISTNDTGSPSLSSGEEDIECEMLSENIPTLGRLMKPVRDGDRWLMECDQYVEHDAMMQFYKETRKDPPYAPNAPSPGTAYQFEVWKRRQAQRELRFSAPDPDEDLEGDGFGDEGAPLAVNGIGSTAGLGNVGDHRSRASSASKESSEASSVRSESSEEDDDGDMDVNGVKDHQSGGESRAVRARDLQSRVCGELLPTMSPEAKRRVLRWAEKDYTWFDAGTDMMEIVASRVVKPCAHCDSRDGKYGENCEESILLKLWTNMTWRKVRRMRHRVRGVNHPS